eukprot:CAMPEP_0206488306 /NCGR_PEP_ID=MMETSP0324_2-20121206/42306_1 /ASSEMBLY_ACC=CAM_ASM_000836 /TAXON_ID=2866 /ORGANISM="Crypthecodinium cohnii, Strain Seligo" /LENGTH=288 /DNA_ID=CAMNT_0053967249 /DNA_START=111 /DNA_END=977 /DNA_ORIENTATION=+
MPSPANRVRSKSLATQARFEALEGALGPVLFQKLEEEHVAEIENLWEEQQTIRAELERVTKLLREEVLPREKMMHELLQTFEHMLEGSLTELHSTMATHMSSLQEKHSRLHQDRLALQDPARQMEDEVNRISQLLSHDAVRPDISNWSQGGSNGSSNRTMSYAPAPSPAVGARQWGGPSSNNGGAGGHAGGFSSSAMAPSRPGPPTFGSIASRAPQPTGGFSRGAPTSPGPSSGFLGASSGAGFARSGGGAAFPKTSNPGLGYPQGPAPAPTQFQRNRPPPGCGGMMV